MKNNQVTRAALFFVSSIIVLVGATVLASALRVRADSVITTVPVGTTPQQIHLTPDGSELFVSNEVSNNISVIATSTDTVIGTIPVGTDPGPIRFTPNGAKAYIANKLSNNVSVIDVATRTETARIPVGTSPVTLAVTLDGSKVYVVNQGSNNVYVISTATDTVIGPPITVGTFPNTTLKTPDGSKLYVANSTSNDVSVISTASDSVVATISVLPSKDPGSIHFLPNGTKAYVANRGCVLNGTTCPSSVPPTVSVINVATNGVLSTINVGAAGDAPHAIRITPDGSKLYLVNKHGNEVKVINTATDTVATTIPLTSGSCTNIAFGVGSCPVRIELTPDGSKAYVVEERPLAANGVLTIICTGVVPAVCASTDTVVGTVALGNSPADIEIMGGIKAYADNSGSNTVSVVALASKPAATGNLSGVYDIQVYSGSKSASTYQCAARLDQYAAAGAFTDGKTAVVCYATGSNNIADPNAEPPASVGPGNPHPPIGPPPPPPYATGAPSKGVVKVDPGTGDVTAWVCFGNVGGTLGPNIIWKVVSPGAANQLNTVGKQVGTVTLYSKQGIAQCNSVNAGNPSGASPAGSGTSLGSANFYLTNASDSRCAGAPGGVCVLAPWRSPASPTKLVSTNFCTDSQRLWVDKIGSPKCGDDPWNPLDVENSTDVSGLYTLLATAQQADVCYGGTAVYNPSSFCTGKPDGTIVPGSYYTCEADVLQGTQISGTAGPNDLKARILCYTDNPGVAVNPDAAGASTCPAALKQFCGDGSPGAYPPGCTDSVSPSGAMTPTPVPCNQSLPVIGTDADTSHHCPSALVSGIVKIYCQPERWLFAHVNSAVTNQAALTGTIDKTSNTINLSGCIKDQNANSFLGNVYVQTTISMHTGHGLITLYANQTSANCSGGTPTGGPLTYPIDIVRQATDSSSPYDIAHWDSDGDGCNDVHELSDTAVSPVSPPSKAGDGGGMRDPSNRWDFFDPAKGTGANAHKHNSSDITAVVQHYAKNEWKDDGAGGVMVNPLYDPNMDRTGIQGSNNWNLGPPNGFITSADILAAVKSYNQNCPQTIPANP